MRTALHFALHASHEAAVKAASPGQSNTKLLRAYLKIVRVLAKHPRFDAGRGCPIVLALHTRNLAAAKAILRYMSPEDVGLCLTIPDAYGQTALHVVAKSSAAGFANFFLRWFSWHPMGANATGCEEGADAPQREPRILRQLGLSACPFTDPLDTPTSLSFRSLNAAVDGKDIELIVRAAIAAKVDVAKWFQVRDSHNATAAYLACSHGRPAHVIRFLLEVEAWAVEQTTSSHDSHGTRVSREDGVGLCGHGAARGGFTDAMDTWLETGGQVDARDEFGRTVDAVAAATDHRVLLDEESVGHTTASDPVGFHILRDVSPDLSESVSRLVGANGGWGGVPASVVNLLQAPYRRWINQNAHVDVIDLVTGHPSASFASYVRAYRSLGQPVLVRGGCLHWPARTEWEREALLRTAGSMEVKASSVPHADLYGGTQERMTFSQFVNGHMEQSRFSHDNLEAISKHPPRYVFDAQALQMRDSVHRALQHGVGSLRGLVSSPEPSFTLRQWIVGPPLSGAPMHFHGRAFNSLVRSWVLWLLFHRQQNECTM